MKLGLIADIHCDVVGLQRALDLFDSRGVDAILCAGDLVEKGKGCDGDTVVEIIKGCGFPTIKGNHDHSAGFNQQWLRENYDPRHPKLNELFLNESTLSFLSTLPETLAFEWHERRVLMAHGTPWNKTMYLYACSPRDIYENMSQQSDADLIILGHTHRPMNVRFGSLQVVNPGSVCGHHIGGSGTCGILTLPDSRFEVFDLESGSRMHIAQTILD